MTPLSTMVGEMKSMVVCGKQYHGLSVSDRIYRWLLDEKGKILDCSCALSKDVWQLFMNVEKLSLDTHIQGRA
jgi:hypothetical protein